MTGQLHVVAAPPRISFAAGIDPGPGARGSAGIAVLNLQHPEQSRVFQCTADMAPWLLGHILGDAAAGLRWAGGIEAFAPGTGPGARRHGTAVTRQVEACAAVAAEYGMPLAARNAALVKNWATDAMLRAAGLYELTAGGTHGRDAMRHALFTAVRDCGFRNPLSTAVNRHG